MKDSDEGLGVAEGIRAACILVVDDDTLVLRLLERVLAMEGYCVSGVASGSGAVQAIASNLYDVLILDLGLPDIDGFDVLRAARAKTTNLKIIATSGYLPENVLKIATHLGADAGLEKPVAPARLVETVRSLLASPA
ncbi:hypothetical protein SBA3_3100008 [Candidatus Sulfopaludibacter sp. SbA3]|nr:hypothetical protein SBA3_3100008 [Candidatus Sulfopaludibacter sp. SbA3]